MIVTKTQITIAGTLAKQQTMSAMHEGKPYICTSVLANNVKRK